jgi:hypothetical protein
LMLGNTCMPGYLIFFYPCCIWTSYHPWLLTHHFLLGIWTNLSLVTSISSSNETDTDRRRQTQTETGRSVLLDKRNNVMTWSYISSKTAHFTGNIGQQSAVFAWRFGSNDTNKHRIFPNKNWTTKTR